MKPLRLSQKLFLKSFHYAPRLAINLLIKNDKGEVLLTRRAIPPQKGVWHYPGTFLLKDEKISECLIRLCKDELGIMLEIKRVPRLCGLFENLTKDPRGHVVDALYEYMLPLTQKIISTEETSGAHFFKYLPRKIGFNHKDTLKQLGFK